MVSHVDRGRVIKLVKDIGWSNVCNMLNIHSSTLSKDFFDGDPFLFLNLFSDLKINNLESVSDWILFYYGDSDNIIMLHDSIIVYDKSTGNLYLNSDVRKFLLDGFKLEYYHSGLVVKEWLSKTYNLVL